MNSNVAQIKHKNGEIYNAVYRYDLEVFVLWEDGKPTYTGNYYDCDELKRCLQEGEINILKDDMKLFQRFVQ